MCREAREYHFASVCVNSAYVPLCADLLKGSDVAVCTVVGFPLGATLADAGLRPGLATDGPIVAVKAPVDSLWRLPGVAAELGPEMRSTGEVLGLGSDYAAALESAEAGVAAHRP